MTLYDTASLFGRTGDAHNGVMPSQVTILQVADEFAKKFTGSSWKTIAVALLLFTSLGAAEWFVTYCGFSNRCPVVQQLANLPASKLQILPIS